MANKVILIGNLTADPEIRKTPNDVSVCSFGMATNRTWKNKETGEKQEEVTFHSLVAWSRLAEIICEYLKKGSKVYISGRLVTRSWEDEETKKKRYKTEIVVEDMEMLGGKPKTPSEAPTGVSDEQDAPPITDEQAPADIEDVEDIFTDNKTE